MVVLACRRACDDGGGAVTFRWGIAGPGSIARRFADALEQLDDAELAAVGSRDLGRAEAFVARHGGRAYGSYEALADDPTVEAVYVATPPSCHARDTVMFLDAGKHVLCEKPFALNAHQSMLMIDAAQRNQRFLMEAMWSRFLPAYRTMRALLDDGEIGTPNHVIADFGMRRPVDPADRHFDPRLGGGGLLDLGVYPVQLASFVFGPPSSVRAVGHIGETGVDEQVAAVLGHPDGATAVVQAALRVHMTITARICGENGVIELPAFMHCPDHLFVQRAAERRRIDAGWEGEGLRFQVEEVHRCLAAGLLESSVMPLGESLSIMRTLDTIRTEIGLMFPGEDVVR